MSAFVAIMLLVGKRLIPLALHWVVHTGSRELFRLAVLAIALGVAFGAAILFDVSFALGAFFAGMILGESQLSRRAAEESLPFRDAFAVLFFVSVGMLFDPNVVMEQPAALLATVLIIVVGKSVAAYALVRAFGHPAETARTVSASLAQIGEFSFILAGLGLSLGLLPPEGRDLILAGAILSILANPFIFTAMVGRAGEVPKPKASAPPVQAPAAVWAEDRILLIGFGRVGRLVGKGLADRGKSFVVIEEQRDIAQEARKFGALVLEANAINPGILEAAGITQASMLMIAIPEGFEAGQIADRARKLNPDLRILARAHSDAEVDHLTRLGVGHVIMGEREIAAKMLELAKSLGAQGAAR